MVLCMLDVIVEYYGSQTHRQQCKFRFAASYCNHRMYFRSYSTRLGNLALSMVDVQEFDKNSLIQSKHDKKTKKPILNGIIKSPIGYTQLFFCIERI